MEERLLARPVEIGSAVREAIVQDRNEALERLLLGSARRGYRIARALLGDRAEAEDAVQEALELACRNYSRLREPTALEGWFFRTLTRACLRRRRRHRLAAWWGRVLGRSRPPRAPEPPALPAPPTPARPQQQPQPPTQP